LITFDSERQEAWSNWSISRPVFFSNPASFGFGIANADPLGAQLAMLQ
jgi:hypothetical protein